MKQLTRKGLALAFAFALCMAFGMGAMAESTEITKDSTSAKTTVKYEIKADQNTYVISISSTIDFATRERITETIKMIDCNLAAGKAVAVKLTNTQQSMRLVHESNTSAYIQYRFFESADASEPVWFGVGIGGSCEYLLGNLSVEGQTLPFYLGITNMDNATEEGVYSDTLTFTASVVDAQ